MSIDLKIEIQNSLKRFLSGNLTENALNLFKTLGYKTDRQSPFSQKTFECFRDSFLDADSRFDEKKAFVSEWKSIDLLFQLSKEDLSSQSSLFDTKQVDQTVIETYLFFAIELEKSEYTRSSLARLTREINRVFPMPVMLVFKHGKNITISVINRRLNKKDDSKDVLKKVTVIKDISIEKPHRAHIEILFDLSVEELRRIHKFTNFVELHNAWQKTLDTKELNKRFYRDLSNWYFWAMREVVFPGAALEADKKGLFQQDEKVREHNAKNLIRLLTRILFIWFIKEKNLIPDELFDEKYIKEHLLDNFEPNRKKSCAVAADAAPMSKYYRAILQNLFFATLNQTAGKREFRKEGQQMNVTSLMRYERYFKNPETFLKLVENVVPFMNGGLFECLDSPDPVRKGKKGGDIIIYEDGFSDRKDNMLCVPDYIFFGTEEHTDLSDVLGNKKQKDVPVSGLINILKSYKFTVTENTPIEEDIALDPELLGRVFENLLASYNPETKTTARKQTGSFYTPREIVNYMVDESLKAYLKQKLEAEAGMKPEDAETGLDFLIGYNEKEHLFDEKETVVLINAIDTCKILDPATGSGAFPMGILHKLVHVLHKLDPMNRLWKERQIKKAQSIDDDAIRDQLIEDIETAFANNELDYGRKLYLIENCIYGVDIQPIAIQISKLRFFISLIVDQKADWSKENFGIRPLPNLETKFVAANTLIGIEKPKSQLNLFNHPEVVKLEDKLKDVRHRLFSAKTPATKRKLREEDQTLREQMGKILENSGWSNESARQLAGWDPYDQNASSPFFDPEWMFGVMNGFDLVIGNPPYLGERKNKQNFIAIQESSSNKYYLGRMDYFYFFFHLGVDFLKQNGILNLITTNYFLTALGAKKLRTDLKSRAILWRAVNFNESKVFDSAAGQHNMILFLEKSNRYFIECEVSISKLEGLISDDQITSILNSHSNNGLTYSHCLKQNDLWDGDECYLRLSGLKNKTIPINQILETIKQQSTDLLGNICTPLIGLESSLDEVYVISKNDIKLIVQDENLELPHIKPFFKNSDIDRYNLNTVTDRYILYLHENIHDIKQLKGIYSYIKKYETQVKNRKGANLRGAFKRGNWWVLNTPRLDMNFKDEKIVTPYRTKRPCFALSDDEWYASRDVYYIIKNKAGISLRYIVALLNSSLYFSWLYYRGKRKGEMLEVYAKPLKEIPIKEISIKEQKPFIFIVNLTTAAHIYFNNKTFIALFFEYLIDAMVYELYFPEEIKTATAEVLKHLTTLPELKDDWSDEKKMKAIDKVYKELSNPAHPAAIAMEKQKTVPEVRIIEGLDK